MFVSFVTNEKFFVTVGTGVGRQKVWVTLLNWRLEAHSTVQKSATYQSYLLR